MAYIVEMGALDDFGNEVPDYSAKDIYNDKEKAKDAYEKLTDDYVRHFLEKDLGFEETDIGYYKKLEEHGQLCDICRWYFED